MSRFTLLDRLRGSVLAGSVGTSASEDKLLSSRESHPGIIRDDPGMRLARGQQLRGIMLTVRLRVRMAQWADEQPGTELSRLPIPV